MITPTQARFLQGLVASPSSRTYSQSADFFYSNYSLGLRVGRQFEYDEGDIAKALNILKAAGWPIAAALEPEDRASTSGRSGISEKSGTRSPHDGLFAYRVLGTLVEIGGHVTPPAGPSCYSVGRVSNVQRVKCSHLLVVENFETFVDLDQYAWVLEWLAQAGAYQVLCIFRGDNIYKVDAAAHVISDSDAPVFSFCDFDPAGLLITSKLPRISGLVAPPIGYLRDQLHSSKRYDLFHDQISYAGPTLDRCRLQSLVPIWSAIKAAARGIPQEWTKSWHLTDA